jgi:hypothetical protein
LSNLLLWKGWKDEKQKLSLRMGWIPGKSKS